MAQRIARAKQRIKASGVPFAMPTQDERPARLRRAPRPVPDLQRGVRRQQSAATAARRTVGRGDPADPAGARLLPDDGEVTGLLALMLLIDARRPARTDADGELVPLAEQDRALWDRRDRGGGRLVDRAGRRERSASTSSRRRSRRSTTARRARTTPTGRRSSPCTGCWSRSPAIQWSRSTGRSRRRWSTGPPPGWRCSTASTSGSSGHYRLDAVRAHLLEMAGDADGRVEHYAPPPAGRPASGAALPGDESRAPQELRAIDVDLGRRVRRQRKDRQTTEGATMKYLLLVCWDAERMDAQTEPDPTDTPEEERRLPLAGRVAGEGQLDHRRPAGAAAPRSVRPRSRREGDRHRRPLRRDQGGGRRLRPDRGLQPGGGGRDRGRAPGRAVGHDRGAAALGQLRASSDDSGAPRTSTSLSTSEGARPCGS